MSNVVIASQTAADKSSVLSVGNENRVTFCYFGTLGATEYIDVQYSHDGNTWHDLYQDGAQVRLSSTNKCITIVGPMNLFRLDKDATASAAGVIRFD